MRHGLGLESTANDAEVVSPLSPAPADAPASAEATEAEETAVDTAVETTEDVAISKSMKKRLKKGLPRKEEGQSSQGGRRGARFRGRGSNATNDSASGSYYRVICSRFRAMLSE